MLNTQQKYIDYIDQVNKELTNVEIKDSIKDGFKLNELKNAIEKTELLIPVIGAFSSGKSSLLNSFLGKDYLPTGITPETALATELRYSNDEYIEAIKSDNTIEKFSIDEINKITTNAYNYKYLKMYINNEKLKEIEPLILVDMPGFDSPLDLHNQAILEYINRGVHYVILTSVEDGTLTRSMIRQLNDIKEFGRNFSFFLSKVNLRSESEAKEIAESLKEQIEDYFDIKTEIVLVDDNGGESLRKIILSIDPEALFKNLFSDILKDNYYTISETLSTIISSLEKNRDENQHMIEKLIESIKTIQKERDKLINEAKEKYSDYNINKIAKKVELELTNSIEEIANVAVTSGQETMSQFISEIIKSVLIVELKDSMNNISEDVLENFSSSLKEIDKSISDFTMTDSWVERLTETTRDMINSSKNALENIVEKRKKSNNNDKIYKAVTTILAVTTNVLAPIIEVIIIFLPDIINSLIKKYQENKQREEIKKIMLTNVIPSITRKIKTELPNIFNNQIQELIINISEKFESELQAKKEAIEATQKELLEKINDIEKTIQSYKNVNNNITKLANEILFKG